MKKPEFKKGQRLRIFGGPNGSGKTTILNMIKDNYNLGVYINADDIEKNLRENKFIDLKDFDIKSIPNDFSKIIQSHSIY